MILIIKIKIYWLYQRCMIVFLLSCTTVTVDDNYMLWGCDLDTQFLRLLNLDGIIPLMLGNLLLSSVPRLDSKQPITLREGRFSARREVGNELLFSY